MASRKELVGILGALIRVLDHADNIDAVRGGSVLDTARRTWESAAKGNVAPLPWTPFRQVEHSIATPRHITALARSQGFPEEEVRKAFERIAAEETLRVNSRYQVNVRELTNDGRHLSIKRIDQEPVHDWRELQRIKNELIGEECEAAELYPAESRKVDSSNQYHLWGSTDPSFRFGFGFGERIVTDDVGPHLQRPMTEEDQP